VLLWTPGNRSAAQECFQRAVDVTPLMAARVMVQLRQAAIPFVVAPYEADAQMAALALDGHVSAVVTEDSDLVAYGTPRVLFKLAPDGSCCEILANRLGRCRELNLAGWDAAQVLHLCVLAGCDYAPSVPGVGIKTAAQLVRRFRTAAAAVRHLRFQGAPVPAGHEQRVQAALWTFAHAWVYDSTTKSLVHRTPLLPPASGGLPADGVEALLGVRHSDAVAQAIAEGRMDPITLVPFTEEELAPPASMPPPRMRQAQPPPPPPARESGRSINAFFSPTSAPAELTPQPSKRTRRERAQADRVAAATVPSLVDSILGDLAPAAPPAAIPVYGQQAAASHPASGSGGEHEARPSSPSDDSRQSVDPSPAKTHRYALTQWGPHQPRPLHPRHPSVLNVAATPAAAPSQRRSRFFSEAADQQEAGTGNDTPASAVVATPCMTAPILSVDLSHLPSASASASSALDKLDSFRKSSGGRASATPRAGVTPLPLESFRRRG